MDFRYRKQAYCQLKYLNGGQQIYNRLSDRCSLFKEALVTIFDQNNYMFWKLVNSFKMMK
jgi:hypothetical protein